jgi:hypothetical protein
VYVVAMSCSIVPCCFSQFAPLFKIIRVVAMVHSISLTRKWSTYSSSALPTVGIVCLGDFNSNAGRRKTIFEISNWEQEFI